MLFLYSIEYQKDSPVIILSTIANYFNINNFSLELEYYEEVNVF